MANVGQGLFMTPGAVRAQEQAPAMTQDQMQQALRGSFFNLGGGVGRGITQAFGGDPRSPAEKQASILQDAMKQIDFNNPQTIVDTMNTLNDKGFQAEAFKLLEALPSQTKPNKQVVDEWYQNETVGDTTKRFLFQRDNFGFITKVGEVSDKAAQLPSFKGFSNAWEADINFDDASKSTFLGRMTQRPEFKSFVNDTDPDELEQFTGLVQKVANDMKDNHKESISKALAEGGITAQQANLLSPRSDDWYLDAAYERFTKAGGIEANIDRGFNISGADVALAPNTNTTDPDALAARIEAGEKKAAAIARVAERTGTLVRGDPRTGQFTVGGLDQPTAMQVFSRMDQKPDEQIMQELQSKGFQFTPELFESHAKVWQIMREAPGVTAKFVNLIENKDLYSAEATRLLDQLDEANNFQQFATASRILKYIGRMNPDTAKKPKRKGGR